MSKKIKRNQTQEQPSNSKLFDSFIALSAKTTNQKSAIDAYDRGQNLVLYGFPGTGKTYLALGLAFEDILDKNAEKIIIVRSSVSTRQLGFLPGSARDKMAEYESPYASSCEKLFDGANLYHQFKSLKIIEFCSTSFLRGNTFDNAVIIIDEFQNMNEHEIYTLMTRVGENCKIIMCGDINQTDLVDENTGFKKLIDTLRRMECFELVEFNLNDIVRSSFVKQFVTCWFQS